MGHGDAVATVVGLLRETWSIRDVPYTAYACCDRKVKVMESGGGGIIEQPVYAHPEQWSISVGKGLEYVEVHSQRKIQQMHKEHNKEMKQMNAMAEQIHTDYDMEYHHHDHFKAALERLGSSNKDTAHLLDKAKGFHIGAIRIKCSP